MKSVEEIYREMMADYAARTGYRPGDSCDLAVRLYAMAAQVQALQRQGEWVLGQAFPQTATGEYLEHHAQTRGIERMAATRAEGTIRFYAAEGAALPLEIPMGTVCLTGQGIRFETVETGRIETGESWGDVAARSMESGSAGNAPLGSITMMAVVPTGVASCVNAEAFTGGSEREGDESLRTRVLESYRRLPNGANAAFYEQEALAVPGVAAAKAIGRARGIGTVDVYAAGEAGLPDGALLEQLEQRLQEKREIAVDVRVLAPQAKTVAIGAAVAPASGYSFAQAEEEVRAALGAYFSGALLGKGIKLAALGDLLYHLDSVDNYAITQPEADIPGAVGVLPVLGSVSLTEGV